MRFSIKIIVLIFAGFQLSCIGYTPAWLKYDRAAEDFRISRAVIATTDFNIVVYKNQWFSSGRKLHVYFDGDGSPWSQSGS